MIDPADRQRSLVKYFLVMAFLASGSMAQAADDHVTIRCLPGHVLSGDVIEVTVRPVGEGQTVVRDVYTKLKELEKFGSLDYAVPDAPTVFIEVYYQNQVLKSAFSRNNLPSDKEEYGRFSRLWEDAFALVWAIVDSKLCPGPP